MSEFPYIHEIVERLSVERKKRLDNAILGEIKEIIKDNSLDTVIVLDEKAIVNALKKQIPKKPIGKHTNYKCPVCDRRVRSGKGSSSFGVDYFCQRCGQALDWSDTE